MSNRKNYTLFSLIIASSLAFSLLGNRYHLIYYPDAGAYSPANLPLAAAMMAIHDGVFVTDFTGSSPSAAISFINNSMPLLDIIASQLDGTNLDAVEAVSNDVTSPDITQPDITSYGFTTAGEDYFDGACFIGDSRTVGISQYAGIENAVFLCQNSLTIYDYEKPKVVYDGRKTSVKDVMSGKQFAKIYIMLGINEGGRGTPETFLDSYRDVVADIRLLQPDALIFIQGNLLVTESKSSSGGYITNENILARNALISTLANQKDIFYIDINESSLCANGALIPDYTWDQVHIRAQYYPIWKEFLLSHAVILQQR